MDQGQKAPALPLWELIETIRADRGWTWTQLARVAGVHRTTIDKWRHQPRSPHPPTVKQAAEGLGIDIQEAMKLAGIVPASDQQPEQGPSREPREEVETTSSDVRVARDEVLAAIDEDPELAIVVAQLLARARGGPPPTERASPDEASDPAYRDDPGDVA